MASLKRHVDEKVGSFWASSFERVADIRKTGDYEVTITTSVPDYALNSALVGAPGVVESAKTLAKDGADYGNATTGVNCTGPFESTTGRPGRASRSSASTTTGIQASGPRRSR